jgi:hypothetical protein
MTASQTQQELEPLWKADETAAFLVQDLRIAHAHADDVASEILLQDLLEQVVVIAGRLKRLRRASEAKAQP